ncbi:peptide chain release factor N(5)-glutamine methyltransferase [Metallumcola ferriviriculae]|uniref:Release factor glutamine methyltransferase n=1 Tax=Metallumcola ferriviriculae TaxID=3039180 RepID=A0AAU0UHN9_9FIRM|nr:peptide chain release factor N(5)-glutamine methyltransferase [Desulfitibacteraceae bacterium MK1]
MTYREMLRHAAGKLKEVGVEYPRLDAGVLLGHLTGLSTAKLMVRIDEVASRQLEEDFMDLVARRAKREPLQYLTGIQEFMSLEFHVSPAVLIPRGDTEVLVEEALRLIDRHAINHMADVGTGSGAIALSIAYHSGKKVWATDISTEALAVAEENALRLGVRHQVTFLQGDLLAPLIETGVQVGLLTANLPYIPTAELAVLAPELSREPISALDGGADGLDYYRTILPQLKKVLEPGGFLLMEMAWDQAEGLARLCRNHGMNRFEVIKDYGGRDRIFKVRLS